MKLSDETIKQVKENRDLIESKDWLKIWETLKNSELNGAFIELGYNPLEGVKQVPPYYFLELPVKSIIIPDTVESISRCAFASCTSLASVTIGNRVKSIGDYAFHWCTSLASVTIPKSVKNIGRYAFYNCSSLKSVVISNRVTSIGDFAFEGCNLLSDIVYKGTIKEFEAVKKLRGWNYGVPATKVICNDGVVSLI